MSRIRFFVLLFMAILVAPWRLPGEVPGESAEVPGASWVVEQSIAYHDPLGHWRRSRFRLDLLETRPDASDRQTRVQFDNSEDSFEILTNREEAVIEGRMASGDCVLTLNGSVDFTDEERERYRLTCERLAWLRDYYSFLWGLPMKLLDAGTRIDPEATDDRYQEKRVWTVRVTYDESVGSDTWYFYFDQQNYALVGYRFFHDEAEGDGEYIVLEGEIETVGLKMPASRAWYTNTKDEYLGTDTLEVLEVTP